MTIKEKKRIFKSAESVIGKLTGSPGASDFKTRISLEPANPAPILTLPARRIGPNQPEILAQIHRPPIELRHRPRQRHRHVTHPPARLRHPRRHRSRIHSQNRAVSLAKAKQRHVVPRRGSVLRPIGGAVEEGVIRQRRGVERGTGEAEAHGPVREARTGIVDEYSRGSVIDVIYYEFA